MVVKSVSHPEAFGQIIRNSPLQPIVRAPGLGAAHETHMTAVGAKLQGDHGGELLGFRYDPREKERIVQGVHDQGWYSDTTQVLAAAGAGIVIPDTVVAVQRGGDPVVEAVKISVVSEYPH